MPFDKSLYPGWWRQFSLYIRKERAGDRCEKCKAPNGETVARGTFDGQISIWIDSDGWARRDNGSDVGFVRHDEWEFKSNTKIVLTVAHLDYEGGICQCRRRTGLKCATPSHVLALCQRCHLSMDMPHHLANRRKTLGARKDAGRRLFSEIV